jgi:hypothetical protein
MMAVAAERADRRNLSTFPDLMVLTTSAEYAIEEAEENMMGGTNMRETKIFVHELMTSHTYARIVIFPGGKISV